MSHLVLRQWVLSVTYILAALRRLILTDPTIFPIAKAAPAVGPCRVSWAAVRVFSASRHQSL